MGAQNEDAETRINGQPGVGVALYLSPDANAVETSRLATGDDARSCEQRFPAGMQGADRL